MVGAASGAAVYDAALKRRQNLMGASGPAALVKNMKVFGIAAFACIGGVLYGYNQGMFSGVLAMPAFQTRTFVFEPWCGGGRLVNFEALSVTYT
jgi:hypothetical protein